MLFQSIVVNGGAMVNKHDASWNDDSSIIWNEDYKVQYEIGRKNFIRLYSAKLHNCIIDFKQKQI